MQEFTLIVLLNWIYQKFSLIFVICLLGCFIRDLMDTMKNCTKINIKQDIISAFACSIILAAVLDDVLISFSEYIFICFFTGIWSFKILEYILNWKFAKILLKNLFKIIESNIGKAFNNTIDELDKKDDK